MAIDDLNFIGVPVFESQTQTPLIVYPNAKLSSMISLQRVQPLCQRSAQVFSAPFDVEHPGLLLGDRLKGAEALRRLAVVQGLRCLQRKGLIIDKK